MSSSVVSAPANVNFSTIRNGISAGFEGWKSALAKGLVLGTSSRKCGFEWEINLRQSNGQLLGEDKLRALRASFESQGRPVSRELLRACLEFTSPTPQTLSDASASFFDDQSAIVRTLSDSGVDVVATGILPELGQSELQEGDWTHVYEGDSARYEFFDGIYPFHFNNRNRMPLATRRTWWAAFCKLCSVQYHLSVTPAEADLMLNISDFVTSVILAPFVSSPHSMGILDPGHETGSGILEHRVDCWKRVFQNRTGYRSDWVRSLSSYFEQLSQSPSFLLPVSAGSDAKTTEVRERRLLDLLQYYMPDVSSWSPVDHFGYHTGTHWFNNRLKVHTPEGDFRNAYLTLETRLFGSGNPYQNQMAFCLWQGLMLALRNRFSTNQSFLNWAGNFSVVPANLSQVCRSGLDARVTWGDKMLPVKELLLQELIPQAKRIIAALGQSTEPLEQLSHLVSTGATPARWIIQNWSPEISSKLAGNILRNPVDWMI